MRKGILYATALAGISFVFSFAAYACCQEQNNEILYYIFLLPIAIVVKDCSRVDLLDATVAGVGLYGLVGFLFGSLMSRRSQPEVGACFWRRHTYAIILPPTGGFLWFAGYFGGAMMNTLLFIHLLFLPLACIVYRWGTQMPQYCIYAVMIVGVPCQYLGIGLLVDFLRRRKGAPRRALALLCAAACVFAFALLFAFWANPHDVDSTFPGRSELAAIVVVYGLLAAALIFSAIRIWRRSGGQGG